MIINDKRDPSPKLKDIFVFNEKIKNKQKPKNRKKGISMSANLNHPVKLIYGGTCFNGQNMIH